MMMLSYVPSRRLVASLSQMSTLNWEPGEYPGPKLTLRPPTEHSYYLLHVFNIETLAVALNLVVLPPQEKHFRVLNSYKVSSCSHCALRQGYFAINETDTVFTSYVQQD